MNLYLIRHAEAEAQSADGSDERRALTRRGRRRFEREVRGLSRLGVRFDRLLFSPLLRAQETADLAWDLLEGESEVLIELAQPPDATVVAVLAGRAHEHTAVVGHEPWLSQLAARLLFADAPVRASPGIVLIEKGGVVHLSGRVADGEMTLVAAHPPRVLQKLGRR